MSASLAQTMVWLFKRESLKTKKSINARKNWILMRTKQVYSLSCLGKFDEAHLPVEKASYTLMTIIRVFFCWWSNQLLKTVDFLSVASGLTTCYDWFLLKVVSATSINRLWRFIVSRPSIGISTHYLLTNFRLLNLHLLTSDCNFIPFYEFLMCFSLPRAGSFISVIVNTTCML